MVKKVEGGEFESKDDDCDDGYFGRGKQSMDEEISAGKWVAIMEMGAKLLSTMSHGP